MANGARDNIQERVPQRWGIDNTKVMLIPPDEYQDAAMARLLSDMETMKYLRFMTKPNGHTPEDAAARRKYRDDCQINNKDMVNFIIALKKRQIPDSIIDKIHEEEYFEPRNIPTDGGSISVDEPFIIVGCCGLSSVNSHDHSSEAGIILDARFWRSGISTVSLYLTLEYGFEYLNLHRIVLLTTGTNVGMRGWMENVVGVKVESVRKDVIYMGDGTYIDSWDYAVFDNDWYGHSKQSLLERMKR
ncbi:hypothetical protein H4R99_004332 [Coemansia sp. RSA 1722]|nr:hypothetical protein LPJ57_005545 [Coemansia sp. RSA 486]KAJ2232280.1 hypothetical protein IWW45_005088 [Coemansia sp. RSA 485]KAJ2597868.1 hypothetical protein H4R99_004332 [Coemansia sp. RSA 1722]KAJ2602283.1 hypothetical protein GGF39_000773 [Coemansia sp. RSA 1721]KAJ2640443.1 hypothetical protein GGF40_000091 [Coemansia sp. RSA 1286]